MKREKIAKLFFLILFFIIYSLDNLALTDNSLDLCKKYFKNKKYKKAFIYCEKAAKKGNPYAQYYIGEIYYKSKNYKEAFKWYLKSAKQGYDKAQYIIGILYYLGKGVERNYTKSFEWYLKAAKQGNIMAQIKVGKFYHYGWGVKRDYKKAFKWYLKAAKAGNEEAQFQIGFMYYYGEGVKQDYKKAFYWYLKAAQKGDISAQERIAEMYYSGEGVKQNYKKAFDWFMKVYKGWCELNRCDYFMIDYFNTYKIGYMYYFGKGVKQDYKKAFKWFLESAKRGYGLAQLRIGGMYYYGEGVKQDYIKAFRWLLKAAKQGIPLAQYYIGRMYEDGKGVKQDYNQAYEWYLKAAKQNYYLAQYSLGVMHAYGEGVIKSGSVAADWFYKAGINALKEGDKKYALMCVDTIKDLPKMGLTVSNYFLADKLLKKIYATSTLSEKSSQTHKNSKKHYISVGTGWPVAQGFIVTNYHVVKGHKQILIMRKDGTKLSGKIKIKDTINDIVLIKVNDLTKIPPALPISQNQAKVGEEVFTIGYPNPQFMGKTPKLTNGIISAVTGIGDDPRFYQISVPLQKGNSGGPLLNMEGEVVGITTYKLDAIKVFKLTGDLPENVNYAIKIEYLKILLNSISSNNNKIKILPRNKASLKDLAKRIENSILIVIAE